MNGGSCHRVLLKLRDVLLEPRDAAACADSGLLARSSRLDGGKSGKRIAALVKLIESPRSDVSSMCRGPAVLADGTGRSCGAESCIIDSNRCLYAGIRCFASSCSSLLRACLRELGAHTDVPHCNVHHRRPQ